MNAYDSIAPPDRVDRTPMDEALRALLGALTSVRQGEKPSVTLVLGEAEWARARTYYQRPYQRKPTSEFGVYLVDGTVWFQRGEAHEDDAALAAVVEPLEARGPTPAQLAEGFVSQTCSHCGVTASGQYRAVACSSCGRGYALDSARIVVDPRMPDGEAQLGPVRITDTAPDGAPAPVAGVLDPRGLPKIEYNQEALARIPMDRDAVNARALQTGTQVLGSSSSVTSTAGESGAVYGGRWVAPEDK